MSGNHDKDWRLAEKPSARDALLLLAASAFCAGLFYLRLRELWPSLFYGALTGCALAAIGAEFFKFIKSHRSESGAGSTPSASRNSDSTNATLRPCCSTRPMQRSRPGRTGLR